MRDQPTELDEETAFRVGRERLERCGVCECIVATEHRAALSGSAFVTFCGSYYCEARAVASLEELRDRVAALVGSTYHKLKSEGEYRREFGFAPLAYPKGSN